jgi:hypothetical protein
MSQYYYKDVSNEDLLKQYKAVKAAYEHVISKTGPAYGVAYNKYAAACKENGFHWQTQAPTGLMVMETILQERGMLSKPPQTPPVPVVDIVERLENFDCLYDGESVALDNHEELEDLLHDAAREIADLRYRLNDLD